MAAMDLFVVPTIGFNLLTPHSIARLSISTSSHYSLSSAAFITNIAGSDFRYTQDGALRQLPSIAPVVAYFALSYG